MIDGILIGLGIIVFIALILGGWLVSVFNNMVTGKQDIAEMWSNIKTEYQRRTDLFFNLVESVKSNIRFEKSTFVEITKARSGFNAASKAEEVKKVKQIDTLLNGLKVQIENYPNLKAGKAHLKLMEEIRITEDRINIARTDYNATVRDYNVYVSVFPNFIIAGLFNFVKEELFNNDEASEKAPKINLKIE